MNLVPIKKAEQQDAQSIHSVRSRVIKNRTAEPYLCSDFREQLPTGFLALNTITP